jgi:hypothetical protein
MSNVAVTPRRRGAELLLAHTLALQPIRPPAAERLRAELGGELSEWLVASLVRDQRGERRGRISPA